MASSHLERALALLQHLARHGGEHGVRSLATALDLPPSTTFRLLETMERVGFVRQNAATDRYAIGMQAVQLGIAALGALDLTAVAPQYLQTLSAETGESAFLAVRDDTQIVYLLKQEGQQSIRTTAVLGSRRPLHCTALGKAYLATMPPADGKALLQRAGMPALTQHTMTDWATLQHELALVCERGYTTDHEEVEEGLVCIGAPVRDHQGATIAAISMAGPAGRILPHENHFGRTVAATALAISTALGYVPQLEPNLAPL